MLRTLMDVNATEVKDIVAFIRQSTLLSNQFTAELELTLYGTQVFIYRVSMFNVNKL